MSITGVFRVVGDSMVRNAVVLDYGCGTGDFLNDVGDRIREGVGIDLDRRLLEIATKRNRFPQIRYLCLDAKKGLPFEDESFDVIAALGVLEHVGPEKPYIREFHRLLRPEGTLLIEVPAMGPFRAFDVGNVKYNFPKLHRWFYYYVARQPEYYERTFNSGSELYGQFSREASQHKHYSAAELASVAAPEFEMIRHTRYGVFYEFLQFLEVVACKPLGRSSMPLFGWLMTQDSRIDAPGFGANIVGVFRKRL